MAERLAHPGTLVPSREVGQVARALLAIIACGGSHTMSSLAARVQASPAVVDLALQVLIDGGRIEEVVSPEMCGHPADGTIDACRACGLAASCAGEVATAVPGQRCLRLVPRAS
ncbi:MAG: hypothetical protein A2Z30_01285 [Chloroflexi bacterium RBG_16_64_43]|nr:MAG: hypothetical protein A2Z30_01285 [Chloroflexi bacterium RBG_16_64_43]